ncbi:MAG: DUF2520 domain-containing protein [Pseudomonadota bacterium]
MITDVELTDGSDKVWAVVGHGRVGTSMCAYWTHLGVNVIALDRPMLGSTGLADHLRAVRGVALAVPDGEIGAVLASIKAAKPKTLCVHFSGALRFEGAFAFHPLYSFPKHALLPETLATIPFACEPGAPDFQTIFPGAPNPTFTIRDEDAPLYHALAVLTGNLPGFCWNSCKDRLEGLTGMHASEVLGPYLTSLVNRFGENPAASFTGPVARRDAVTVKSNLAAIEGDAHLKVLYSAFLAAAWPEFGSVDRDTPVG